MASPYPATEGLQHISHDHEGSGLYFDERGDFQRDGVQPYDKQTYTYSAEIPHGPPEDHDATTGGSSPQRRICGLTKKLFIILLVVFLVIVIGAIGGGVGGALAAKSSRTSADRLAASLTPVTSAATSSLGFSTSSAAPSPTSTQSSIQSTLSQSSSTTSTSAAVTPTTTAAALVILDCPSSNGTTYTPSGSTSSFLKYCGMDLQSKSGATIDIQSRTQANFDDCIDSCAAYTDSWVSGGSVGAGPCAGVAFNALIPSFPYNDLRCFLKVDTGGLVFQAQVLENVMASAMLVSS